MKTGSSALQLALTQHPRRISLDPDAGHVCEYASLAPWALLRGEVLREAGLRSASLYSNSAGLEAIVKEDPFQRNTPLIELKRMRTEGIVPILSCETWLHECDYVHEFASLLDAPLHVVAYVCPQTAWFNSLFWQTHALSQKSLESFISKHLPTADWALCLEAWQTAPGVEKLSIRLKCHDIVPDFCGLLECESLGEGEVWNPGFPMALARYVDRWNLPVFFRDGLMKQVFSRWISESGTEGGIPHSLGPAPWVLAPSHIKQVVERFAEGNRRMLEWCEPAVAEKIRNDPRWWSTDPADHPPQNFEFIPSPEGRRGVPGRRIEPRAELLGDLLFEADKLVESLLGALVKADEALRSAELKAAELARKTGEKSF